MDAERPVEIPLSVLNEDTLISVLHSFIQREGTDYGFNEVSLEKKVEQLRRQLEKGDVLIAFDQASESLNLLTRREWEKLIK